MTNFLLSKKKKTLLKSSISPAEKKQGKKKKKKREKKKRRKKKRREKREKKNLGLDSQFKHPQHLNLQSESVFPLSSSQMNPYRRSGLFSTWIESLLGRNKPEADGV